MQAVRAPWTTSSFLIYSGGLVILASTVALLSALSGEYGKPAFVAWSLLVLVVLDGAAFAARAAGRPLVAGLLVVSGVVALAVFVGALESWFGWLGSVNSPFEGFHVGNMVVVAVLIADAIYSLRVFRFPLLVFFVAGGAWYLVTDILSSGGGWTATVTITIGVVLMLIGLGVDRIHGFWVQVVAGLTIGGGLLYFWHSGNTDWILLGITALVYIALAGALDRSSYAVLGALGLLLTWTHFVVKWFGLNGTVPFFGNLEHDRPWARALAYAGYGVVLMLLGLWVARRRASELPAI